VTLPDLLVVAGILGILIALLLPMLGRVREKNREVTCIANLRNLSLGFASYAANEGGYLPNFAVTQIPWENAIRPYISLPVSVFVCPSDNELAPVTNSSYDWRDLPDPAATLAGKRLADARSDAILAVEGLPGWHRRGIINVAYVNGTAEAIDQKDYATDWGKPVSPYGK
jgi:hypothetical protein